MIRTLAMIAIAGFVLSIASFSAAIAIGGPEAMMDAAWSRRWGWSWTDAGWGWGWRDHHHHGRRDFAASFGPDGSRELAWTGGDSLEIQLPAEVSYSQAPGPGRLVISGPQDMVRDVELDGGRLHLEGPHMGFGQLKVTMTAPDVRRFDVSGSGRLDIDNYRQDRLEVDLSGSGEVTAHGQAREINLDISGSGNADLGGVAAENADVQVSGSGTATVAPTRRAKLDVAGSGGVTLKSRPDQLESEVSGSGHIHQEGGATLSRTDGRDS
jgi:hypothetical protein